MDNEDQKNHRPGETGQRQGGRPQFEFKTGGPLEQPEPETEELTQLLGMANLLEVAGRTDDYPESAINPRPDYVRRLEQRLLHLADRELKPED